MTARTYGALERTRLRVVRGGRLTIIVEAGACSLSITDEPAYQIQAGATTIVPADMPFRIRAGLAGASTLERIARGVRIEECDPADEGVRVLDGGEARAAASPAAAPPAPAAPLQPQSIVPLAPIEPPKPILVRDRAVEQAMVQQREREAHLGRAYSGQPVDLAGQAIAPPIAQPAQAATPPANYSPVTP